MICMRLQVVPAIVILISAVVAGLSADMWSDSLAWKVLEPLDDTWDGPTILFHNT